MSVGTVRIGRLTLHAGPLSESEARELARSVAEAIALLPLAPAGAVRVQVHPSASGGVESLREAIAREVQAALAAPGSGDRRPAGGPA